MGCLSSLLTTSGPGKPYYYCIIYVESSLIGLIVCRYTFLESSTTVPVVPPRHDGYPRFLSAAWPYYAGAISTSAGFIVFAAMWLAGDDRAMRKGGKAGKTE